MPQCPSCKGSGRCYNCGGDGKVGLRDVRCPHCDGSGKCKICGGTGEVAGG